MVRETRHLWVSNLPELISEDRIRDHFKRYGPVQSVKVVSNNDGVGATVAFVDICSAAKAHKAEHRLEDRSLKTTYYETSLTAVATSHYPSAHRVDHYSSKGQSPSRDGRSPRFPGLPEEHNSFDRSSHFYENRRDDIGFNGPGLSNGRRNYGNDRDVDFSNRGRIRSYNRNHYVNGRTDMGDYRWGGGQYRCHSEPYFEDKIRRPPTATSPPPVTRRIRNNSRMAMVPKRHRRSSRSGSESPISTNSRSSSSSSSSSTTSRSSSSQSSARSSRSNSPRNKIPPESSLPSDKRPVALLCVKNLPPWSTDISLKDGLYHDYKKYGKVISVRIFNQNERYAIVCFKKEEDAHKALEASKDKQFFGVKVKVSFLQNEDLDEEIRNLDCEMDEYSPKATRTLFIGGLDKDVVPADLRKIFEPFGEIIEIDIKKQNLSTFAFCQFSDIRSVVQAVKKMDGEYLGSNRIKLGFGKSMPSRSVWVGGIAESLSESALVEQFSKYGIVTSKIVDREKGHALIDYENERNAASAVTEMRGYILSGRKLQIDFASRECHAAFLEHLEKQQEERSWSDRRETDKFDRSRRDNNFNTRQQPARLKQFPNSRSRRYDGYEEFSSGRNFEDDDSYERDLHEYAGRQRYENGTGVPLTGNSVRVPNISPVARRDSSPKIQKELSPAARSHDDRNRTQRADDHESIRSQSPSRTPISPNKTKMHMPRLKSRSPPPLPPTKTSPREVKMVEDCSDPRRRKASNAKSKIVVKVSDYKKCESPPVTKLMENDWASSRSEPYDPRLRRGDEVEAKCDMYKPLKYNDFNLEKISYRRMEELDREMPYRKRLNDNRKGYDKHRKDIRNYDDTFKCHNDRGKRLCEDELQLYWHKEQEVEYNNISPPGTPVRDEREEPCDHKQYRSSSPKLKAAMNLPLPKFAIHMKHELQIKPISPSSNVFAMQAPIINPSTPVIDQTQFDDLMLDTPVSPGPVFQDVSDSENELELPRINSLELNDRIRALDEMFGKWNNSRSHLEDVQPAPSRKFPVVEHIKLREPSDIAKSLLNKSSIFDSDTERLRFCILKYEPEALAEVDEKIKNEILQPPPEVDNVTPAQPTTLPRDIPSATPLHSLPGLRTSVSSFVKSPCNESTVISVTSNVKMHVTPSTNLIDVPSLEEQIPCLDKVQEPVSNIALSVINSRRSSTCSLSSQSSSIKSKDAPMDIQHNECISRGPVKKISSPVHSSENAAIEDVKNISIDLLKKEIVSVDPLKKEIVSVDPLKKEIISSDVSIKEILSNDVSIKEILSNDLHKKEIVSINLHKKELISIKEEILEDDCLESPNFIPKTKLMESVKTEFEENPTLDKNEPNETYHSKKRKHSSVGSEKYTEIKSEPFKEIESKKFKINIDETKEKLKLSKYDKCKYRKEESIENTDISNKQDLSMEFTDKSELKIKPLQNISSKEESCATKVVEKFIKLEPDYNENKKDIKQSEHIDKDESLSYSDRRIENKKESKPKRDHDKEIKSSNEDKITSEDKKNVRRIKNKDRERSKSRDYEKQKVHNKDKNRSNEKDKPKHKSSHHSHSNSSSHHSVKNTSHESNNDKICLKNITEKKRGIKCTKQSELSLPIDGKHKINESLETKEAAFIEQREHKNGKDYVNTFVKNQNEDELMPCNKKEPILNSDSSELLDVTHEEPKDFHKDPKVSHQTKEKIKESRKTNDIIKSDKSEPCKPKNSNRKSSKKANKIEQYQNSDYINDSDSSSDEEIHVKSKRTKHRISSNNSTKSTLTSVYTDSETEDSDSDENTPKKPSYFDVTIYDGNMYDKVKARGSRVTHKVEEEKKVKSKSSNNKSKRNIKSHSRSSTIIHSDGSDVEHSKKSRPMAINSSSEDDNNHNAVFSEESDTNVTQTNKDKSINMDSLKLACKELNVSDISSDENNHNSRLLSFSDSDQESRTKPPKPALTAGKFSDASITSKCSSQDNEDEHVLPNDMEKHNSPEEKKSTRDEDSTEGRMKEIFGVLSDDSSDSSLAVASLRKSSSESIKDSPNRPMQTCMFESDLDDDSRSAIQDLHSNLDEKFELNQDVIKNSSCDVINSKENIIPHPWRNDHKESLNEINRVACDSGKGSSCGVSTTSSSSVSSAEELQVLKFDNKEENLSSDSTQTNRHEKKKRKHKDKNRRHSLSKKRKDEALKSVLIKPRKSCDSVESVEKQDIEPITIDDDKTSSNDVLTKIQPDVVALDMPVIDAHFSNESVKMDENKIVTPLPLDTPTSIDEAASLDDEQKKTEEPKVQKTSRSNISQEETLNAVAGLLACYNEFPDSPSSQSMEPIINSETQATVEEITYNSEAQEAAQILQCQMPEPERSNWKSPGERNNASPLKQSTPIKKAEVKNVEIEPVAPPTPDSPSSVQSEPVLQIDESPVRCSSTVNTEISQSPKVPLICLDSTTPKSPVSETSVKKEKHISNAEKTEAESNDIKIIEMLSPKTDNNVDSDEKSTKETITQSYSNVDKCVEFEDKVKTDEDNGLKNDDSQDDLSPDSKELSLEIEKREESFKQEEVPKIVSDDVKMDELTQSFDESDYLSTSVELDESFDSRKSSENVSFEKSPDSKSSRGRSRGRGRRGVKRTRESSASEDSSTSIIMTRSSSSKRRGRGRSTDDMEFQTPEQPRRSTRTKKARKHPDMVEHEETTIRRRRTRGARANLTESFKTESSSDVYDFHDSEDDDVLSVKKKKKTEKSTLHMDEQDTSSDSKRKSLRLKIKAGDEDSSTMSASEAEDSSPKGRQKARSKPKEEKDEDMKRVKIEIKEEKNEPMGTSIVTTNASYEVKKTTETKSVPIPIKVSILSAVTVKNSRSPVYVLTKSNLKNTTILPTINTTLPPLSISSKDNISPITPVSANISTFSKEKVETDPTSLVDPVTGIVTPMKLGNEGQYVPVSGENKCIESKGFSPKSKLIQVSCSGITNVSSSTVTSSVNLSTSVLTYKNRSIPISANQMSVEIVPHGPNSVAKVSPAVIHKAPSLVIKGQNTTITSSSKTWPTHLAQLTAVPAIVQVSSQTPIKVTEACEVKVSSSQHQPLTEFVLVHPKTAERPNREEKSCERLYDNYVDPRVREVENRPRPIEQESGPIPRQPYEMHASAPSAHRQTVTQRAPKQAAPQKSLSHYYVSREFPADIHKKGQSHNLLTPTGIEYLASPPMTTPPSNQTPPPAHHNTQRENIQNIQSINPMIYRGSPYMVHDSRPVYGNPGSVVGSEKIVQMPIDLKLNDRICENPEQKTDNVKKTVVPPLHPSPQHMPSPYYDRSTESPKIISMMQRRGETFQYPGRTGTPGVEHEPRSPHFASMLPETHHARIQVASPQFQHGEIPYILLGYHIMWEGFLGLKNDQALIKMHFISGNVEVAKGALVATNPVIKISQRMRLEQSQLEGVARKMQMEAEHCVLMVMPSGRNPLDNMQQQVHLENGFIKYLGDKKAAGIVNVPGPGTQQSAFVIHIFPPCDFANESLLRIAPDLHHATATMSKLLVVIATC